MLENNNKGLVERLENLMEKNHEMEMTHQMERGEWEKQIQEMKEEMFEMEEIKSKWSEGQKELDGETSKKQSEVEERFKMKIR